MPASADTRIAAHRAAIRAEHAADRAIGEYLRAPGPGTRAAIRDTRAAAIAAGIAAGGPRTIAAHRAAIRRIAARG